MQNDREAKPTILSSRLVGSSWHIDFFQDKLQYGSSKPFLYARFSIPDVALVVAFREEDGKIPLVRQYRHGARSEFWELPAGFIEKNEKPIECIKREFSEEVGYELKKPKLLAKANISPSRTQQVAYLFSGLVGKASKQELEENEKIIVEFVDRKTAMGLISKRISSTHLLALLLSS